MWTCWFFNLFDDIECLWFFLLGLLVGDPLNLADIILLIGVSIDCLTISLFLLELDEELSCLLDGVLDLLHCDVTSLLWLWDIGLGRLLLILQVEDLLHLECGDDYLSRTLPASIAGSDFSVRAAGSSPGGDTLVWLGSLGRHLGQVTRWRWVSPAIVNSALLISILTLFANYAVVDALRRLWDAAEQAPLACHSLLLFCFFCHFDFL